MLKRDPSRLVEKRRRVSTRVFLLVLTVLAAQGCATVGVQHKSASKNPLGWTQTGVASWYGRDFHKRMTASGEAYNMYAMTAAHKTLPLHSRVRVNNLQNGKTVVVRINDRGPYVEGRIIDLTKKAAQKLGMVHTGTARVRIMVIR